MAPAPSPAHGLRPVSPCRNFRLRGCCAYGSKCRFYHAPPAPIRFVSDGIDIGKWLETRANDSEHDIIFDLTSAAGFDTYSRVVNLADIPDGDRVAELILEILTRPKLRQSLLKQRTDQIYNALLGSTFMKDMPRRIRQQKVTIPLSVSLYEELISRNSEWCKIAPLDLLQHIADKCRMAEQAKILARLVDYRSQQKSLEAMEHEAEDSPSGSNFRDMPLLPLTEQILVPDGSRELPKNTVDAPYPDVRTYLGTHFQLLQEECIANLRDGIHDFRNSSRVGPNAFLYTEVRRVGYHVGEGGLAVQVTFNANARQPINWQFSKRLMFGSLLCISCDNFQTFLWAKVASREPDQLSKGTVGIQLLQCPEQMALLTDDVFVMLETHSAYFEARSHALRNLQKLDMDNLPFQEHLLALESHVKEPIYLQQRKEKDLVDFDQVFPEMKKVLGSTMFPIMQSWPEWPNTLDESQMFALQHGLTKRLALIQGPPGTGKSFIGQLIVKIMLLNFKRRPKQASIQESPAEERPQRPTPASTQVSPARGCPSNWGPHWQHSEQAKPFVRNDTRGGPILVLCHTNHALDDFLEGVLPYEKYVIRVGRRSKSAALEPCQLHKHVNTEKNNQPLLRAEEIRLHTKLKELEQEILKCADLIKLAFVTRNAMDGIATEEEISSLFYDGCDAEQVVQLWLNEQNNNEVREGFVGLSQQRSGLWSLDEVARRALHTSWVHRIHQAARETFKLFHNELMETIQRKQEVKNEIDLIVLRRAKVVGMTTSAATRYQSVLKALQAEIIVVEEAAEVPESHIVTCLTPSTKHLVLIGDHLQLRPVVAVHRLATQHNLHVSMFERLVKSGLEIARLEVQRRMRPSISKLISGIYPVLRDHESVFTRENIKGLKSNVFFLHHTNQEESEPDYEHGKVNIVEAQFVVEFCAYLLRQGYLHSDITILSMYRGQTRVICDRLARKLKAGADEEQPNLPRVSTVDDYQGEECKIIILSLVRNYSDRPAEASCSSIGFLAESNRMSVALSRARDGLFVFGNGDLLSFESELWEDVVMKFKESQAYGEALVLTSSDDPEWEMEVRGPNDFQKLPDGGCTEAGDNHQSRSACPSPDSSNDEDDDDDEHIVYVKNYRHSQ